MDFSRGGGTSVHSIERTEQLLNRKVTALGHAAA